MFVKGVKRRTRKKFTAEEKIRIVVEGMKREVSVAELCRREGIPSAAYYSWTKDFMEGGKAQLQRDARRHADASGVEALKKENAALRDLVAIQHRIRDVGALAPRASRPPGGDRSRAQSVISRVFARAPSTH